MDIFIAVIGLISTNMETLTYMGALLHCHSKPL